MADVKNYAVHMTDKLVEQVKTVSESIAYCDSKIRVMPDGHPGKGAVVGSTITYTNKIVPSTVGVDIACRVSLYRVPNDIDFEELDRVMHEVVPTGYSVCHREDEYSKLFDYSRIRCWESLTSEEQTHVRLSMGSMGGGKDDCPRAA